MRIAPIQPGTVVQFEQQGDPLGPFVLMSTLGGTTFHTLVVDTTDASGKASIRIKLGTRAGRASLRIVVPEHGYVDSVSYTVLAGAASAIRLMPRDTSLRIGRSFTLRGGMTDRFGNDRNDPVVVTAENPPLSISGRVITAAASGRGRVIGVSGAARDTVFVGIVPEGTISVLSDGLLTFRTDGSELVKTASGLFPGWGADWSPDGQLVAFDNAEGGPVRVLGTNGVLRNITRGTGLELYPRFSADGQWLYYSANAGAWQIRRVHPDGNREAAGRRSRRGVRARDRRSPDGRWLIARAGRGTIDLIEVATGMTISLPFALPGWGSPAWKQ